MQSQAIELLADFHDFRLILVGLCAALPFFEGSLPVFLGLIACVAVPASLFSIGYMAHHQEHGVGRYYPNLLVFLAAMYGLVSTTDMMWFFFIFWQMMTWTGWGLIRYERRKPQNLRAAWRYLWMMQLACAVTMMGLNRTVSNDAPTSPSTGNSSSAVICSSYSPK